MKADKRIITLYLLSFSLIPFFFSCKEEQKDLGDRPNILWITCEDISPNLGAYGDSYAYTPHLDQLAKEGVLYTHAFATAPVCAVARSTIISGMYASSQGTQHMRCNGKIPEGISFYPEILRKAGYYCSNNVKTDYNFEMDHASIWDESSQNAHWRNRKDKEQPFFSIFNFTQSHESRVNNSDRYLQTISKLSPEILKKPGEVPLPPYYPDTPETRELWARYYNIITAMDQKVGEVLKKLKEDGLEENTIVIFYSDHGAGIPRHKRWLYDSGLRVPLIVRMPEKYKDWIAAESGSQTDELLSFIDLPPTALHLAGIEIPTYMQGRSFLGKDLSPRRSYIYAGRDRMDERYDMQRAVRDKRFKYIRYYEPYKPFCQYMNTPEKGGIMRSIRTSFERGELPEAGLHIVADTKPAEELFDTEKDPYELHNLALDPIYQEKLEEMRKVHAHWSEETKDGGLIPETILRDWEKNYERSIYQIMREKDIPVNEIRQTALAEISPEKLMENLGHPNAAVRYWAAISLGNQHTNLSFDPALTEALKDEVPVVSFAVARALQKYRKADLALPILVAGLEHEDEWVRLNAAQVLDEMGEAARPAIPALQSVMEDKNKYVVRVANHALNQLLGTTTVVR
ncbi:MAG: sulfatase-like hydrolase/transferase [Bacteroidia bacterium]|nr:sulfatase-like hydrolase/transferase [Bacteroidia bacterium]